MKLKIICYEMTIRLPLQLQRLIHANDTNILRNRMLHCLRGELCCKYHCVTNRPCAFSSGTYVPLRGQRYRCSNYTHLQRYDSIILKPRASQQRTISTSPRHSHNARNRSHNTSEVFRDIKRMLLTGTLDRDSAGSLLEDLPSYVDDLELHECIKMMKFLRPHIDASSVQMLCGRIMDCVMKAVGVDDLEGLSASSEGNECEEGNEGEVTDDVSSRGFSSGFDTHKTTTSITKSVKSSKTKSPGSNDFSKLLSKDGDNNTTTTPSNNECFLGLSIEDVIDIGFDHTVARPIIHVCSQTGHYDSKLIHLCGKD